MDDRSTEVLLGKIAHELRNPTNAIAGWVGVLRLKRPDDETLTRGLESIERNVRLQADLLDDMLDFVGLASGKLRLRFDDVDIVAIANDAVDNILPEAQSQNVLVVTHFVPPMLVRGDRSRMLQVFGNILSNAIKFTPSGGRIDLHFESADDRTVRVHVRDTGKGIPPESVERIFDLFEQGAPAEPLGRKGLGIGLALVRQIVEQHGGTVRARSDGEGRGATLVLDLPAANPLPER